MEEILELVHQSRLLVAKEKYDEFIRGGGTVPLEYESLINQVIGRCKAVQAAMEIGSRNLEGWTLGMTYLGVTTHYKAGNDGCIAIRLEGVMDDLPIFEQAAVIHEFSLLKEWAPFCTDSITITKVSAAELVGYFNFYIPPLNRDTVIHAYGVDCLPESGKLFIIGKSIDTWPPANPEEKKVACQLKEMSAGVSKVFNGDKDADGESAIPWCDGWFQKHMEFKELLIAVEIISPTSAKPICYFQVDPKTALPQSLINFVIRNLAGIFLYLFRCQVQKVSNESDSLYYDRIQQNKDFYTGWLLPKLRNYCALKGWEQPTILSLGVDGLPPATTEVLAPSSDNAASEAAAPVVMRNDGVTEDTPTEDKIVVSVPLNADTYSSAHNRCQWPASADVDSDSLPVDLSCIKMVDTK